MPLYEYEPTLQSEHEPVPDCCFFETLQSMSELALVLCPTCGHAIHRAVSSFSYAMKNAPAPRTSTLGKGLFQNSSQYDAQPASQLPPVSDSAAKRAARMAMRHICASGCRH